MTIVGVAFGDPSNGLDMAGSSSAKSSVSRFLAYVCRKVAKASVMLLVSGAFTALSYSSICYESKGIVRFLFKLTFDFRFVFEIFLLGFFVVAFRY